MLSVICCVRTILGWKIKFPLKSPPPLPPPKKIVKILFSHSAMTFFFISPHQGDVHRGMPESELIRGMELITSPHSSSLLKRRCMKLRSALCPLLKRTFSLFSKAAYRRENNLGQCHAKVKPLVVAFVHVVPPSTNAPLDPLFSMSRHFGWVPPQGIRYTYLVHFFVNWNRKTSAFL